MNSCDLEKLVKEFNKASQDCLNKNHDDLVVNYCLCQDSLDEAIKIAVLSRGEKGKMHSHQRRIGYARLYEYYEHLLPYTKEIQTCNNFDELYKILDGCKFDGIGLLALYDIAFRIAAFMEKVSCTTNSMLPDRVYLHAGSKKGAEILLGRNVERTEPKSAFPPALQSLTCDDIESFLCRKGKKLSLYKED